MTDVTPYNVDAEPISLKAFFKTLEADPINVFFKDCCFNGKLLPMESSRSGLTVRLVIVRFLPRSVQA